MILFVLQRGAASGDRGWGSCAITAPPAAGPGPPHRPGAWEPPLGPQSRPWSLGATLGPSERPPARHRPDRARAPRGSGARPRPPSAAAAPLPIPAPRRAVPARGVTQPGTGRGVTPLARPAPGAPPAPLTPGAAVAGLARRPFVRPSLRAARGLLGPPAPPRPGPPASPPRPPARRHLGLTRCLGPLLLPLPPLSCGEGFLVLFHLVSRLPRCGAAAAGCSGLSRGSAASPQCRPWLVVPAGREGQCRPRV